MENNKGFNNIYMCLFFLTQNSCGGNFWTDAPKRLLPFWSPLKKIAGIVVTWWWSEIGAGNRALRSLSVAYLVGFERNRQGFGFWCEFFGTLGPTEPGKCNIQVEEQSPDSSYLFNLKNCSKPFLSNGEEVSLFAHAVFPGVSQVKCWAGHHQGGTGTHLLQHISCKCSYYLDVLGFRNDLVDQWPMTIVSKIWKVAKWVRGGPLSVVPQESQSQAGSPMSLVVGLIQKQIVKDFWQI